MSQINHLDVGSEFIICLSLHDRGVVVGFKNRRRELEVGLESQTCPIVCRAHAFPVYDIVSISKTKKIRIAIAIEYASSHFFNTTRNSFTLFHML